MGFKEWYDSYKDAGEQARKFEKDPIFIPNNKILIFLGNI